MNKRSDDKIAKNDNDRSKFIYAFLQKKNTVKSNYLKTIPKIIIQYWHSDDELPDDVSNCIDSWKTLKDRGFDFRFFNDFTAKKFIKDNYSKEYLHSYLKCHHPAMRCDYFRLCYLYKFGGFYIDSDELYLGGEIDFLFENNNIKIQPFCYSLQVNEMVSIENFLTKPYDHSQIYYFNNNPIVTPPYHKLIEIALNKATNKLLNEKNIFDIQSTTGPGNLSASVIYYLLSGENEIEVIDNWDNISKSPWPLSYRSDNRNWRLYDGKFKKYFDEVTNEYY